MQLIKTSILLVAAASLTACASSAPYSGGRTWDEGWRQGVIESVNDALKWYQSASCNRVAAPGDKFVVVSYRAQQQASLEIHPHVGKGCASSRSPRCWSMPTPVNWSPMPRGRFPGTRTADSRAQAVRLS